MPKYRTFDYRCNNKECEHFEILLLDLLDPAEVSIEGKPLERRECPQCGQHTFHLQMAMPTGLRASYADGQKRKGWDRLREASKLEKEKAVTKDRERRKEIQKEIKKTGIRIGRGPA